MAQIPHSWSLDHLAVTCADLDAGIEWAESKLGLRMQPGGQHTRFGTHNALLGLGDIYLEVIAPDPTGVPEVARWFGLDTPPEEPRLGNWICQCDDLTAALAVSPAEVGSILPMQRGDLRWSITVPQDGSLPLSAGWPTLITWGYDTQHPSARLASVGCQLKQLFVRHPQADWLRDSISPYLSDDRITFETADVPSLAAEFQTRFGVRVLE